MKRIVIAVLLILIALLFLWAAHLDGVIHVQALALNKCEFCEFIENHDIESDRQRFAAVLNSPDSEISYELVLFDKLTYKAKGADRTARNVLKYGVKMDFCPECGRKIN